MKTNLLLLDSYKNIDSLVAYAFSFSHRTNRNLKIIYVFDFDWMRQSFSTGAASEADPVLINVQSNAKKEYEDAEVKIRTIAGEYLKKHSVDVPFELYISDKNRVDLIRQETEEHSEVVLLLSNSQSYAEASGGAVGFPNLISNVKCPVFVVPDNSKYAVLKHVLYATNFHREDIESIKHLVELVHQADLHMSILHNVREFGFDEKLRWIGFLELVKEIRGVTQLNPVLTQENTVLAAVENYVRENTTDLVVMLKEKKGFFKEVFNTSNTKNVLTHFMKPVLVYHEN